MALSLTVNLTVSDQDGHVSDLIGKPCKVPKHKMSQS